MRIDDRVGLTADERASLARELAPLASLEQALKWAFAAGHAFEGVVVQDEFTHDVTFGLRGGRFLVFDTT